MNDGKRALKLACIFGWMHEAISAPGFAVSYFRPS